MRLSNVLNTVLNVLTNLLISIVNFVLTPINLLVSNLFPDVSQYIAIFNNFVNTRIGTGFGYFFSILPPFTKGLIIIWLSFCVVYYPVYYTYIGIVKLYNVIQRIKLW